MPGPGAPAEISTDGPLSAARLEASSPAASVPESCPFDTDSAATATGGPPARVLAAAAAAACVGVDVEIAVASASVSALRSAHRIRIRTAQRAAALPTPGSGPSDARISGCSLEASPASVHQPSAESYSPARVASDAAHCAVNATIGGAAPLSVPVAGPLSTASAGTPQVEAPALDPNVGGRASGAPSDSGPAAGAEPTSALSPSVDSKEPTTRSNKRRLYRIFRQAMIPRSSG